MPACDAALRLLMSNLVALLAPVRLPRSRLAAPPAVTSCVLSCRRHLHASPRQHWTSRTINSWKHAQAQIDQAKMEAAERKSRFDDWSRETLIQRVKQLERELLKVTGTSDGTDADHWKQPSATRQFDRSKYSTRFIALKLAYLGKNYNGFEWHANNRTALPTIEEELWKAFSKARLIFPDQAATNPLDPGAPNWNGCDYAKCGRTDKGVSAFGQVISLRVRSNRPLKTDVDAVMDGENGAPGEAQPAAPRNFDEVEDEIQYPAVLNKLLPKDIRVLAWCPSPPADFSARHSCRERQYRYFFTQPAFAPEPESFGPAQGAGAAASSVKPGWLNIAAMQEAAQMYEGLHDFRNFCKVDPGKQITNFERRIFYANIEPVRDDVTGALAYLNQTQFTPEPTVPPTLPDGKVGPAPTVWCFRLHGSAFLWHQVRHMVALLFLVGQGLETPQIIADLLDITKNPGRPAYEMASDVPLVLWDCVFPRDDDPDRKESLDWIYVGNGPGQGLQKHGPMGVMSDLWQGWREHKIDEVLSASLLGLVASQGKDAALLSVDSSKGKGVRKDGQRSVKVFEGGNSARLQGKYQPVLMKKRVGLPEELNERYALKKGYASSQDMKEKEFEARKRKREQGGETLEPKDPLLQADATSADASAVADSHKS